MLITGLLQITYRLIAPNRRYEDSFDEVFCSTDREVKLTPVRSLNLQAYVERVIQTIKHDVLNAFCIVINERLDGIVRTTQRWYNQRRGHSSRDHLPPICDNTVTVPIKFSKDNVVCDSELGGHLLSYRHVA